MVVSVDGASVTAVPGTAIPVGAARSGQARSTRRDLLRGLLGTTAALALAPLVAASRPSRPRDAPAGAAPDSFEETYHGRRLRGVLIPTGRTVSDGAQWEVTVDGRPLHLMRRADGTWLSMIDHYRSYATPLEAARAAVDELGPGEKLRDTDSTGSSHPHDGTHMGGHHGLHA